jgi:hypothetical protein
MCTLPPTLRRLPLAPQSKRFLLRKPIARTAHLSSFAAVRQPGAAPWQAHAP